MTRKAITKVKMLINALTHIVFCGSPWDAFQGNVSSM